MPWHVAVSNWLLDAAVGSSLVLILGLLCVLLCRQPVRRLQLLRWTFVGCLLLPCLQRVPGYPRWPLGFLEFPAPLSTSKQSVAESKTLAMKLSSPVISHRSEPAKPPSARLEDGPPESPLAQSQTDTDGADTHAARGIAYSFSPRPILVATYFTITSSMLLWWLTGLAALVRLRRRAQPAPRSAVQVLRELAGAGADDVQLLTSPSIEQPLTFGWRRPVIVLPTSLCTGPDLKPLRWCLAHEWSRRATGRSPVVPSPPHPSALFLPTPCLGGRQVPSA